MADERTKPKVFLSYSWTSPEHTAWVAALAERLKSNGVLVVFDQYALSEGHDKYHFMEQMVTDPAVNKVLAICDVAYATKANNRKGGVGTESQIISKEVFDKVVQDKFIPLIRQPGWTGEPELPVFFRSRIYIDFSEDAEFEESYERLLRNLFARPALKEPPLGTPPRYLFESNTTVFAPASSLRTFVDAAVKNKPHLQSRLDDYLDVFLQGLKSLAINYSPEEKVPLDEKVMRSIADSLPYRNSFVEFTTAVATYYDTEEAHTSLFEFFENVLALEDASTPGGVSYEESTDNYRFIMMELMIYFLAVLIRKKRFATASLFIDGTYHRKENRGEERYLSCSISCFRSFNKSLDETRLNRLNINTYSVTADTLASRSEGSGIAFADICQVDFLLFLRPFFPGGNSMWYPQLLPYTYRNGQPELFGKATSTRGMAALKILLRVDSLKQLVSILQNLPKDDKFLKHIRDKFRHGVSVESIVRLDDLARAVKPG